MCDGFSLLMYCLDVYFIAASCGSLYDSIAFLFQFGINALSVILSLLHLGKKDIQPIKPVTYPEGSVPKKGQNVISKPLEW